MNLKRRGSEPVVHHAIMDIVRHSMSPELLNRIDETVVFNRLQREHMDTIAAIGISEIAKRLEEGQNMTLDVSSTAQDVLAEQGYDVRYGARPLKRVLNRELLNPLSRLVLEGAVKGGDVVRVRTRAEAEKRQKASTAGASDAEGKTTVSLGWISSNPSSDNKNDVVIIRNHEPPEESEDEEMLEENGYLLDESSEWPVHK
jgi:ATP-dependent protease Clp ATPase subunit